MAETRSRGGQVAGAKTSRGNLGNSADQAAGFAKQHMHRIGVTPAPIFGHAPVQPAGPIAQVLGDPGLGLFERAPGLF